MQYSNHVSILHNNKNKCVSSFLMMTRYLKYTGKASYSSLRQGYDWALKSN